MQNTALELQGDQAALGWELQGPQAGSDSGALTLCPFKRGPSMSRSSFWVRWDETRNEAATPSWRGRKDR